MLEAKCFEPIHERLKDTYGALNTDSLGHLESEIREHELEAPRELWVRKQSVPVLSKWWDM